MFAPAILLLAACAADAPPSRGDGPRIDAGTVHGRMALELWQLRPGITLAAWATANLADQVHGPDSSLPQVPPGWCARAVSAAEVDSQPLQREVFFYPPLPPDDLSLPDSATLDLVQQCRLGFMRLAAPRTDALVSSIERQLDSVFGPGTQPGAFAPGFHGVKMRREHNGLTVYTANDARRGVVVAAHFSPLPDLRHHLPGEPLSLDSAALIAGLDSVLWLPLRAAASDTARGSPEQLVAPLARWVRSAQSLPPPARAAALYAADAVLERALCRFQLCDRERQPGLAPLTALGAAFSWSPLGGVLVTRHAWMHQARILHRDSRVGDWIFMRQLNRGFDFSGRCERGPEGFRAVISNAERYLSRVPEGPISGDVHFMLAEAYRDIVALASGGGDGYADSSDYVREAPEARRLATFHYRAAISADSAETGRAAWQRAWWLMAGLPVRDTRFFCVYD